MIVVDILVTPQGCSRLMQINIYYTSHLTQNSSQSAELRFQLKHLGALTKNVHAATCLNRLFFSVINAEKSYLYLYTAKDFTFL